MNKNSIKNMKPKVAYTSLSTMTFINPELINFIFHKSDVFLNDLTIEDLINGYKHASLWIDNYMGAGLFLQAKNSYIIFGSGADRRISIINTIPPVTELPKPDLIPPKLYRCGTTNHYYVMYSDGRCIHFELPDKANKVIYATDPYGLSQIEIRLYQISSLGGYEIYGDDINYGPQDTQHKYCIMNEHTALSGVYGVVSKGPKDYNEYESYYLNIVNTIRDSIRNATPENKNFVIEYSDIARDLLNAEKEVGTISLINNGSTQVLTYNVNTELNRNKYELKGLLSYNKAYYIYRDQLENRTEGKEPLPYFINTVDAKFKDLMHFESLIDDSNTYAKFCQEIDISPSLTDGESERIANLQVTQERNALTAMKELYNNYLSDILTNKPENVKLEWMFCDNALLLVRDDGSYYYIDVIKYNDRYNHASFRQVIKKATISNLIVSYSNNILTLKFSATGSQVTNPTMVRMYNISDGESHKPIYSSNEYYEYKRIEDRNHIVTDDYRIKASYYSNGILVRTNDGNVYEHVEYRDGDDVPDIIRVHGEELIRLRFNTDNENGG